MKTFTQRRVVTVDVDKAVGYLLQRGRDLKYFTNLTINHKTMPKGILSLHELVEDHFDVVSDVLGEGFFPADTVSSDTYWETVTDDKEVVFVQEPPADRLDSSENNYHAKRG